jgi:hypothetical protein
LNIGLKEIEVRKSVVKTGMECRKEKEGFDCFLIISFGIANVFWIPYQ